MISVATSGDAHVQSLQQNTSWVNSNLSFIGSTSRLGDHYGYHWEPEPKSWQDATVRTIFSETSVGIPGLQNLQNLSL